ncbi:MAG TPA: hypothetical protein PKW95_22010 [bacterium]|nr:hypothetical protein [bacterium]
MPNPRSNFSKGVSLPQLLVYLTLAAIVGLIVYKQFIADRCGDDGFFSALFQDEAKATVAEQASDNYDPFRDRPKVGKPQMPTVTVTTPTPEPATNITIPPPPTQPKTHTKSSGRVVRKRT